MTGNSDIPPQAATPAPLARRKHRRGPGRPWKPGQSGNPFGVGKGVPEQVAYCRALALSHAPKAITRLAKLLNSADERVQVAAAEGLLDRAGLRPYALEPERIDVRTMVVDPDALRAHLLARAEALVRGTPAPTSAAVLEPAPPGRSLPPQVGDADPETGAPRDDS